MRNTQALVYAPPHLFSRAKPPIRKALLRWLLGVAPALAIVVLLGILLVRGERWSRQILGFPYGDELLLEATAWDDLPAMKHAICEGASPNAHDHCSNVLMWAIGNNNEMAVLYLLKSGAQVNAMCDVGKTALIDAVWAGHPQMVKLLLDHGADPNQYNEHMGTPLFQAVVTGNEAIVQLLLAHGADPNLPLANGTTPLDVLDKNSTISPTIRAELLAAGARRSSKDA